MPSIDTATGFAQYGDTSASSYFTNILQDFYLPSMADAVLYPNIWLSRIPRDGQHVEGKKIVKPVHYDDANGAVALGEQGLLPDPDTEKFARYGSDIKHLYVRCKISGVMKDAAATNIASWLKVVDYEMSRKAKLLAKARQRMYHNDGSGRLCQITTGGGVGAGLADATLYNIVINQGIESPATCTTAANRWLKPGMVIAIVSSAGVFRGVTVVGSSTATTLTTGAAGSTSGVVGNVTSGDWVVTYSQQGTATAVAKDSGFKNEPMGLAGMMSDADPDDGTTGGFQGIDSDSATFAFHRASILANGGVLRPLTFGLMDLIWTTSIEVGDTVPSLYLTSFPIVRAYAALCIQDRRFVGEKEFDGGYAGLEYNGVLVLADKDAYNNRINAVDETDFTMNVMADVQWMDMDGSIFSRLGNTDAYQATMYCREQLTLDLRKKHTLAVDIQE